MSNNITDQRPDFMKGIYIPPQPAIIEQIREISPDLSKIAQLISKDAGISANIIRTVNSAAYNLNREIGSINQAVMLLGLDSVINITNGLMIRVAFEKYDTDNLVEFWQLNEEMAICCSIVARAFNLASPEHAYLLGLFHNCGLPALSKKYPQYTDLLHCAYSQTEKSIALYIEEKINTNHAIIGYIIARNWKLPDTVSEAIREHLETGSPTHSSSDNLLTCLQIAGNICEESRRLVGVSENSHWPNIKDAILAELFLCEEDFSDMAHEVREQVIAH